MKRLLLLLTFAVICGSASATERDTAKASMPTQPETARATGRAMPLGRLFFTPSERAQLDVARTQKKAPAPVPTAEPVEPPQVPQVVTYSGIIRRSDGKALVWVNNRMVEEKEALAGLNVKGRVRPDGAMTLQVPQSGDSIEMKVGQSVELHTGKVAEGRKSEPEARSVGGERTSEAAEMKSATPAAKPQNVQPQKQAAPAVKSDAVRSDEALAKQATIGSSPAK